jgi:hypothetical protein
MAVVDKLAEGEDQIRELRDDLAKLRSAIDRTDAVLAGVDETLRYGGEILEKSRRRMPLFVVVGVVGVVGVAAVLVVRRRRRAENEV